MPCLLRFESLDEGFKQCDINFSLKYMYVFMCTIKNTTELNSLLAITTNGIIYIEIKVYDSSLKDQPVGKIYGVLARNRVCVRGVCLIHYFHLTDSK